MTIKSNMTVVLEEKKRKKKHTTSSRAAPVMGGMHLIPLIMNAGYDTLRCQLSRHTTIYANCPLSYPLLPLITTSSFLPTGIGHFTHIWTDIGNWHYNPSA